MITRELAKILRGMLFPRKLWTLANCDAVASIRWACQGTTVQIDSVLVVEECFMPDVFNMKSNQHVLRQMSYYNFQKIDRKFKVWEFRHDYFQAGREDLLHLVKRQPLGVPKKYARYLAKYFSRIQSQSARGKRLRYANLDQNVSDGMEEDSPEEARMTRNEVQHPQRKSATKLTNSDRNSGKKPSLGQDSDKHSPMEDGKSCPLCISNKNTVFNEDGNSQHSVEDIRGNSKCKAIKGGRHGRSRYRKYQGGRQKYVPFLPKLPFEFGKSCDQQKCNLPQSVADGQRSQNLFVNPEHAYVKSNNVLFEVNDKNGPVYHVSNMASGENPKINVNDRAWLYSPLLNETNNERKMEEIDNKMQCNASTFHPLDIPEFDDLLEDNEDDIRYLVESTERVLNARNGDLVDQNDISYSNANTGFQQNPNGMWNPHELYINDDGRLTKYMTSISDGFNSNDFELPQNRCINSAFFKDYSSRKSYNEPSIETDPYSGKQYVNLESFPCKNATCISTNDVYVFGGKMPDSLCNGCTEVSCPENEGKRSTENVPSMTELLEASRPNCSTSLANHTLLPSEQADSTNTIPSSNWIGLDHNYKAAKKFNQNELLECNFNRAEVISLLSIEPTLRPESRESTLLSSFIEGDSVTGRNLSNGEAYLIEFPENSLRLRNTSAQSSYSPENADLEVLLRQVFKSEPDEENGNPGKRKSTLSNSSNAQRLLTHPASQTVPQIGCSEAHLCTKLQLNDTNSGSFENDSNSKSFNHNSENYDLWAVLEQFNTSVSSQETQQSIISDNGFEIKRSLDDGYSELTSVSEFLKEKSKNGKKYAWDLKEDIVIKKCGEDYRIWKVKKLMQSVHL